MTKNKRFRISQGYTDRFCHDWKTNKLLDFKQTIDYLNTLYDENEKLKKELKEFKDFVFSDEKILCYSCVYCLSKGIYEVECSEKGKVDVHGSCFLYWKNELGE